MNEQLAIATLIVIGVTAYTSYRAFRNRAFLDALMFSPSHILGSEQYYRIFSSALIHADWSHCIFNMFSLYAFGSHLEQVFGAKVLALIYITSIAGGSLLSLYLHRNHEYRALGASGGVCGVIFASIFMMPGGSIFIFPIPIPIPSWVYAILFLVISFRGMRTQQGNIGHDAHLGGALVGLAVATLLYPAIVRHSPFLYAAVITITAILFLYSYRKPAWARAVRPTKVSMPTSKDDKRPTPADAVDEEELDSLLAKISRAGISSLTEAEKHHLTLLAKRKKARESR